MGSIGLAHLKIRYFIQTGGRVYSKWIMCLSLKGRQTISNNKFPRLGQSSKRCQISSKTWGQGFLLGSLLLLFPNMQHQATNLRPGHVQDINTFNTYPRRFLPATFICRASPKSLMSVVLRYQLGAPDHPDPDRCHARQGSLGSWYSLPHRPCIHSWFPGQGCTKIPAAWP
jgi:hypothetical protein